MPKAAKRQKTAATDENAPPEEDFLDDEEQEEQEGDLEDYEDDDDQDLGGGPAGTIARVHVQNFMNHENLDMQLCSGMNYVIGKNGSGKSAMAHAAQVALGASARETQRGTSMAKFVRHGQASALVKLEIRNTPEVDAWEYELYGDKVIIERRIHSTGGGGYTLKDACGKKISNKRDDLQRMLDHYNIQVDNPCSVLTQDESKKLAASKPEQKYDFYLKASGLKAVLDQLRETNEKKKALSGSKQRQAEQLAQVKSVWEAFEKEYEENAQLRDLESQQQHFKEELVWSHVHNARDAAAEKEKDAEDIRVEIEEVQRKIDTCEGQISELEPEMASFQTQLKQFEQDTSADRQKLANLQTAAKDIKGRTKAKTKRVSELSRNKGGKVKEIESLAEQIESLQNQPQEDHGEHKSDRKAKMAQIAKVENAIAQAQQVFRRLQEDSVSIKDEIRNYAATQNDAKRATDAQAAQVRAEKKKLEYLAANSQNVNSKFGHDVALMMDAVENNARKFKVKPVGPVGAFINVKDAKWATAVEAAIGSSQLSTILVHCREDEMVLDKLIKQNRINKHRIGYAKTAIDGRSYKETGQLKLQNYPSKRFVNVMDMVDVTHPAVENYLFDSQTYQNLLFNTREEVMQAMWKVKPENARSGYLPDGDRFWKSGNSQQQAYVKTNKLLGSDNSSAINAQKDTLEQAEAKVLEIEKEWDEKLALFIKSGKDPKARMAAMKKEEKAQIVHQGKLGRELDDLREQLNEGEEEDNAEQAMLDEIADMKSQTQTFEEEVEMLESQLVEEQAELAQLQQALAAAEQASDKFRAEAEAKQDNSAEEYTKVEMLGKRLDKLNRTKKNELSKHREKRVSLNTAEKEMETLRKEAEQQRTKAVEFCDGNENWEQDFQENGGKHRSTEWLEKKIRNIDTRLRREAEKQGGRTLEAITLDRDRSKSQFQSCEHTYENTAKIFSILHKGIKKRGNTYKDFRRSTANMARKMFNKCLGKKGHSGDLKFQHSDNTLDLEVSLNVDIGDGNGRKVSNTRTLSGGEKSFTTLSLLLALGYITSVPFAIFDEIDVFMDDVNRKVTLQALQDEAKDKNGSRQYCVLTPQDLTGVKTDDSTAILKMPEPERMALS